MALLDTNSFSRLSDNVAEATIADYDVTITIDGNVANVDIRRGGSQVYNNDIMANDGVSAYWQAIADANKFLSADGDLIKWVPVTHADGRQGWVLGDESTGVGVIESKSGGYDAVTPYADERNFMSYSNAMEYVEQSIPDAEWNKMLAY